MAHQASGGASTGSSTSPVRARGDRPAENEFAFAQRKLEENYSKIYRVFVKWRTVFDVGQEVLVWKRPVLAAVLYLAVHALFFCFTTNNESFLTQLSTLLFWLLIGDAIWRAATKDDRTNNNISETRPKRETRRREMTGVVAFEKAILLTHEQRSCKQFILFEVVCLTVAQWWMWVDNIWLALMHWSTNDPLMFSLSLAVPGLILAVVGKYIPTAVLLYVLVMGVLVWPYIRYHDLIQKALDLISAHYPVLIRKIVSWWKFLKTLFATNDDDALREFSLVGGGERDSDTHTQEMLNEELSMVIGQPVEGGRGESGEGVREREEGGRRREGEVTARHRAVRITVDPGMSVLQDSVLGMTPGAFHDVEDSLASFGPGTGEFPSISNLDQSLSLPQFPSEDIDHHRVPTTPHQLTTIQESEEAIADDLDPLNDSTEYEFGLDTLDTRTSELRHRSATSHTPHQHVSTRPHPLVQYSISAPITGFMYPLLDQSIEGGDTLGRRTPPPSYEAVVTSQYMESGGFEYHRKTEDGIDPQRTVPKSSSTPLLGGYQ